MVDLWPNSAEDFVQYGPLAQGEKRLVASTKPPPCPAGKDNRYGHGRNMVSAARPEAFRGPVQGGVGVDDAYASVSAVAGVAAVAGHEPA
ncbi:hypothetical protein AA0535_3039 [Asaia krungthepensis NRIC 0535]|uniref:Uncharacterized protein n=1 Tax=Asaia krungthepensis NRIC 0535 TaxID=1307925 RepID=A0ABQ0Q6X3_9PROT|nr:hypothetical protein AA0535_3039 [Asaia krungthepensis NRIC 0535]